MESTTEEIMKHRDKHPPIKPGRRKLFQMCILVGLQGPRANIWTNAVEVMKATQFVGQCVLEQYISHFNILDRGRYIRIEKFSGQLELDQDSEIPKNYNFSTIETISENF